LKFKILILLSIAVHLNLSGKEAQQLNDTEYVEMLYDSTKIYYSSGDYTNAIKGLDKILLLKSIIPDDTKPEYFKVYNRLGLVNKKRGNLQKAIENYRYALENTTDKYNITFINDNIANIYSLTGDYAKAINYLESSLTVLEKSNRKEKYRDIVENYHNQGFAYYKSGQMVPALKRSLESIRIAKENKISVDGEAYYNCGLFYQYLDSLVKADIYLKKAVKYYIGEFGENHYMTAMAYMNYGDFYAETGEFLKSEQLYKKAYGIFINTVGGKHRYTSYCLKNNGRLYYKTGNHGQALNYYQASLISKIYSFNDSSIYINPKPDVLPDLDLLDILKLKAQVFEKLAAQEDKETNLKAALSTLELTVGFIEQLRTGYLYESSKLQLAAQEHETYLSIIRIANSLYEISGDINHAETAFKYSELSKYALLRELKNEEMSRGFAGVPDSISNNERRIKEQIGSIRMQIEEESKIEIPDKLKIEELKEQIFSLTQELEILMQELESNYPAYYRQKYSNKHVNITQLQKAIDKKDAILEYVLGDSTLYTFAITKDTFLLLKQDADSAFYSNLDFYKTVLHREHSSNYSAYTYTAYNLYKKLIYPIEPLLKNKNLLIIPDDKMNFISFDVLLYEPYKNSDTRDYVDYEIESYLLKKYAIGYAYSATLFANTLNNIHKGSPGYLGIAPSYGNSKDSLRHLPLGLTSVKKIALLTFGKSLIGNKATKNNFNKFRDKYDIIHFYAHGFEDTLNPAYSKLCLSPASDTIGGDYLYAWEVNNMQLNARLVVLASCYSGSGKLSKGEGVMSMGRSFMNAGSESVISSLWAASYMPTISVLNYFYRNLLKGMRKDEAMRLAKLRYLKETDFIGAHPRFWAGMVVTGNQSAIYKSWYLKKIVYSLILIALIFVIFKKRKQLRKFF
jgi:CHAT domain-containing protein/tetratricopeptide (TPR) repeat protein